mmetsp:Transcript_117614/g.333328  ORF Transcript_117614/g.333328 Transcript_117614/m.333328 type:complete len:203 (+) Transcript_117614:116-724(+)
MVCEGGARRAQSESASSSSPSSPVPGTASPAAAMYCFRSLTSCVFFCTSCLSCLNCCDCESFWPRLCFNCSHSVSFCWSMLVKAISFPPPPPACFCTMCSLRFPFTWSSSAASAERSLATFDMSVCILMLRSFTCRSSSFRSWISCTSAGSVTPAPSTASSFTCALGTRGGAPMAGDWPKPAPLSRADMSPTWRTMPLACAW